MIDSNSLERCAPKDVKYAERLAAPAGVKYRSVVSWGPWDASCANFERSLYKVFTYRKAIITESTSDKMTMICCKALAFYFVKTHNI